MAAEPTTLAELAARFMASLNERDFETAATLYASDAVYESPSVAMDGGAGRIVGRDEIIRYFADSLDGDDEFQLHLLDSFVGVDMVVLVSSLDGRAFVDVLRTDDTGAIVEHREVSPKPSPLAP